MDFFDGKESQARPTSEEANTRSLHPLWLRIDCVLPFRAS